jgi:hypothetical protein
MTSPTEDKDLRSGVATKNVVQRILKGSNINRSNIIISHLKTSNQYSLLLD